VGEKATPVRRGATSGSWRWLANLAPSVRTCKLQGNGPLLRAPLLAHGANNTLGLTVAAVVGPIGSLW
jgi:hypothetical protein